MYVIIHTWLIHILLLRFCNSNYLYIHLHDQHYEHGHYCVLQASLFDVLMRQHYGYHMLECQERNPMGFYIHEMIRLVLLFLIHLVFEAVYDIPRSFCL